MPETLRVIRHTGTPATLNMAIDEALAESQKKFEAMPTLRFYEWESESVTVGYFENVQSVAKRFHTVQRGVPVVRRLTGGGAVCHRDDLTFSLCMKIPNRFFPNDVKSSYLKINEVMRAGLKEFYPSLDYADCRTVDSQTQRQKNRVCFETQSCYDLLLNGKKVLGASQRRLGSVLLHQTTLFLPLPKEVLVSCITQSFAERWKLHLDQSALSDQEWARAHEIEGSRYADSSWALSAQRGVKTT